MYVYRFINSNNEIIYIGKAKDLKNRLNSHDHLPDTCYSEIDRIEYIVCLNTDESSIYERYLINKISPKYNTQYDNNSEFSFELPEKEWKVYNKILFNKYSFSMTNEEINLTDADLGKLIRIVQKGLIQGNILCNKKDIRSSFMTKYDMKDILKINIKAVEQFIKRLKDKGIIVHDGEKYKISERILIS